MKINPIYAMLLALALFAACKSTTTVVGNSDTGTLKGNVALVTALGDTLPTYAGATIQIQGTSFHTTSNATGAWEIDNMPAGIYNVILTKPGFDTLIIPGYQFNGVGTSFLVNTGIQAIPMDSLVFTVTNTTEDSTATYYLGLLSMSGSILGPDSLALVEGVIAASGGGISQAPQVQLINGKFSDPNGLIGYNEPPDTSGSIVTFRSYLYANLSLATERFTYFQQATSPYVVRTLKLP
jgi:hypothetical protein